MATKSDHVLMNVVAAYISFLFLRTLSCRSFSGRLLSRFFLHDHGRFFYYYHFRFDFGFILFQVGIHAE